ncbi:MAG: hypothetical protein N3B11_03350, partial [Coriobacteriia bacterium]|nr:hypothetical protein [Coriobacteriia bacterium]
LGASIDATAERVTLVTGSGRVLDPNTALHAMACLWCKTDTTGRGLAVPVSASRVIEDVCGAERRLVRVGTTRRALSAAALDPAIGFAGSQTGGFVFPDFLASYDAVMTIGMLLRMLEEREATLDDVVSGLPEFHLRHASVPCPFSRKGAVMRTMAELAQERESEMTEGVRIIEDGGWALVLPHPSEASVDVHAEGRSPEEADGIIARYVSIVDRTIAEDS